MCRYVSELNIKEIIVWSLPSIFDFLDLENI